MIVLASLVLSIVCFYYSHHAKLQTSLAGFHLEFRPGISSLRGQGYFHFAKVTSVRKSSRHRGKYRVYMANTNGLRVKTKINS